MKNILVILDAGRDYGLGENELMSRVRKYSSASEALIAYSETPCLASFLVETEEEAEKYTSLTLSELYEKYGDSM